MLGLHAWQCFFALCFLKCLSTKHRLHAEPHGFNVRKSACSDFTIWHMSTHCNSRQQFVSNFVILCFFIVLMRNQQETCAYCHDNGKFYGCRTCELQNRANLKLLCGNIQILLFSPKQISHSTETPLTFIYYQYSSLIFRGGLKENLIVSIKVYNTNTLNTGS